MSEATPGATAPEGGGIAAPSEPLVPEPKPNEPLSVRALLEVGAHFGHQTRRWDPRMKGFIFGERNGIHIIDLDQTLDRYERALEFLRELTAQGGKVLFVGTKPQAQVPIQLESVRSDQFYVNRRWLGGMLTNFRTVKKSIERFKELLSIVDDEDRQGEFTKRERARFSREIEKYGKSLEGIKEMNRLPDAMFVVDVKREHIAVTEAKRLGIPVVAIVDSNCNPDGIDYVIPANDDAIRAIMLYCVRVADACADGAALHQERLQSQAEERAPGERAQAGAPSSGRKVVEIKQPPRRGRGDDRGGRGAGGGRRPEAKPPPTHAPPRARARAAHPAAAPEAEPAPAENVEATEAGAAPEAAAPEPAAAPEAPAPETTETEKPQGSE